MKTKIVSILSIFVYSFATQANFDWDFGQKNTWLYVGGNLGTTNLTTDKDKEAGDKDGNIYGAQISSLLEYNLFDLNLTSSYYYMNFQSEREDNLRFNLETQTLSIEASPLFNIFNMIDIGPKLHMVLTDKILVGPSDKSNETDEALTTRFALGANAYYKTKWKKYTLRFGGHWLKPISIGPRDANMIYASVEIGQLFK